MKSQLVLVIASVVLAGALSASGEAASIYSVSVGNANIPANGTGEVAVTVTGAGDSINLVGYEFRISPTGGATSQLQFLDESESFLSDPNYVFTGNSAAANDGTPSSVGTVSTSTLPSDTFIGGDGSNDFADVPVSGSKLLVKLAVKHIVGPADPLTTIGHQFAISLVPFDGDSAAFGGGTSNTGFLNSSLAGVPYTSQTGTITVVVPEPASVVSITIAVCALFAVRPRAVSSAVC